MAFTYGSVTKCKVANGQTRNEYECRLGYEVQSQSIANNTSSVKLRLEVRSISSSYKSYGYNQTTTIDGTSLSAKEFDMRNTNTWQNFGERTITVTHNTNGSYSASKSGSFTTTASSGYSLKSGSASVTVAPATIPRYVNFTQHYVSRVSTSSITVYWNADAECDWLQYSINGGSWVDTAGYPEYTIYGLAENSTYNIRTKVRRKDSQLWTESGTITGTTLAKTYPSISVASKTETSITVNSSCNVEVSSTRYRIMREGGGYGSWQTSDTFSGLSANTTYTVQVEKVGKVNGEAGYAQVDVTTYYYPHCTSAPDFKIGNNVKLDFYNPLNRTIKIQMWSYTSQGFVSDQITINGTTYTGFSNVKDRLYASIPDKTESQYTIDVWYGDIKSTKWNGGKYSTNGTENPVFSNFSYEDINDKTKELTGNNQILVNGYSNLKVTISTANKAYSNYASPINKYRLNVGNMSSVEAAFSNTNPVDISINSINSPSITVTAIDGRNYTAQVSKTATFKGYFKPIIKSMVATRSNGGVGSQVTLSFDGEWWNDNFGAVANSIKNIEYYYKKTTDTNWTKGNVAIIPTINENNFSGNILIEGPNADDKGFDVATAYNIKMTVTDALATSTEYQTILGTGTPAIAICNNKVAIGQKYDEELGGTLQVDGYDVSNKFKQYLPLIGGTLTGKVNFNKGGEIYDDGNYIKNLRNSYYFGVKNPATWVYIGEFSFSNGGQYAVINCYLGDGQNGNADQNTHAIILLKQGWTGMELPIGITTNFTQNYSANIKVKIYHTSKTSCKLYMYLPFYYNDLTITLDGSYISCSIINEDLSTEPTTDRESAYYDLTTPSKAKISNRNTTDTWIPVFRDGYFDYTLRQMPNSVTHTDYPYDQDWLTTRAFLSFWNGAYNGSNNSNLYWCSDGEIQAKPVVGYSNEAGTTGTVTLSVNAGNYNHIRITYRNSDGQYGSTTVSGVNNATCTTYGIIIRQAGDGSSLMINSALFNVSGNTITISRNQQANIFSSGTTLNDPNSIYITKVELWN